MPRIKLTATGVERVKPRGKTREEYFDTTLPGFALRVTGKGHKSWVLFYRAGRRQRRMTLGSYPALDLVKAREAARDALQEVAKGHDPATAKIMARNAEPDIFEAVAAQFIEKHAKRRNRSWAQTERLIDKELTPEWGQRSIAAITRRDVLDLLDSIIDRGSPALANKVLGTTKTLFYWALDRDLIEANPAARVRPPAPIIKRERVVSDDEIRALWAAWEQMGYPHGRFMQMLLITAQRRSEVANMRWSDFDPDERVWSIPAEMNKSGRGHEVPLSPLAMEIVEALPHVHEEWLFASKAGKPISGFSPIKRATDKLSGVEGWRFHDLRRTCATGMARLGIPVHTISRVLNHVEGGVTAIYDRHSYLPEKRHALEMWTQKLESVIRPGDATVVRFRSGS